MDRGKFTEQSDRRDLPARTADRVGRAAALACGALSAPVHSRGLDERFRSEVFLAPSLSPGQQISQVFSRTVSTRIEGLDPIVKRISGTGTYRLVSSSNDALTFDSNFLYDGRPPARGDTKIKRDGTESCWQSNCAIAADASGLLLNSRLWGVAPKIIGIGSTWHVKIPLPWELGPQGEEDVTVVALDAATGTITLMRGGKGDGAFDNDPAEITITKDGKEFSMDAKASTASWSGYTTITKGIIVNDELLVERSLTLSSKELGSLMATQRQYILLNKMPLPGSWK